MTEKTIGTADYIEESYVFLGAGAAVLLQLAVPGVGHGVADHSNTLSDPLGRLRTTMSYIYAISIGTPEEKRAIVKMVNKAHIPVRTESYSAFDPDLQLWVAATLYKGGVDLLERFRGPLDPASNERIYREAMEYGNALQVRPEMWPQGHAEFTAYWDRQVAAFEVDDQVRGYVQQLLSGGSAPWPIRLGMPLNRLVTAGLLPPRARELFGLEWGPRHQRAFDLLFRALPVAYRFIPRPVRTLPARLYRRDMAKRLASGRGIAR